MKTETKEVKKVLKKVFMVGHSDCPFGEEIVQDVSLFGELNNSIINLINHIIII